MYTLKLNTFIQNLQQNSVFVYNVSRDMPDDFNEIKWIIKHNDQFSYLKQNLRKLEIISQFVC